MLLKLYEDNPNHRDILKIVKEHPGNEGEMKGILNSIDEMCGLA